MPRHARLRISDLPLHVIQRGNNRAACFVDENDYTLYLGLLQELSPLFACNIHAYVLMTNHVHMLATPGVSDGLSRMMKHLGQRYVQHFNRRHGRTGTLWEGRFRSSIVDSETYLFRCQRYVELNPVRAGMVSHPLEHRWSSYRHNTGLEPSLFVVPHPQFMSLGNTPEQRASIYRDMFREALTNDVIEEIRRAANAGYALGSPAFLERLGKSLNRRVSPGTNGRPRKGTSPGRPSAPRNRGLSPV